MPKLIHQTSTAKGDETKRNLANTAMRLYKEKGYENVGVREIAAEAGMTTGAFYYHFKSKEETLRFHVKIHAIWLRDEVPKLLKDQSPLDKIRLFLSQYLCDIFEEEGWQMCENRMFSRFYGGRRSVAFEEELTGFVEEALADGSFPSQAPVEEIVQSLLIAYRGVEYHWCSRHGECDLRLLMRRHIDMVIGYYQS